MEKYYIGLACTMHDGALAILDSDGEILFAEATERYLQYKRSWDSPPDSSIRMPELLRERCPQARSLVVAKSWSQAYELSAPSEPLAKVIRELETRATNDTNEAERTVRVSQLPALRSLQLSSDRNRRAVVAAATALRELAPKLGHELIMRSYDHHLCHAAAGCYTSPFEEAACAVIDGFGEHGSYNFYHYRDGRLRSILPESARSSASLGLFYSHVCRICGFDPVKGEEWKVMGLAPYGKMSDSIYRLLDRSFSVDGLAFKGQGIIRELEGFGRKDGAPAIECADLAFTAQQFFCDRMTQVLRNLYERGLSDNLVLGGGCALNSSCNGQLLDRTPFKRLHVWCAPGDDGNAVGAAQLAFREDHPASPPSRAHSPYLGSSVSRDTLDNVLEFSGIQKLRTHPTKALIERSAELLAGGKIIGWVQGRAEFGPRALGNRSILADPRRADIKETLNAKVKFREEFRPFAPSILHEHGPDFFESFQESPYMERTLRFRDEVAGKVPGVVHVDQTGRLQTVKREHNPLFYGLIEAFFRLTGVPLLLNTSFNVMGKPIMHSVEDALAVFYTSGLDALVIESCLIEK